MILWALKFRKLRGFCSTYEGVPYLFRTKRDARDNAAVDEYPVKVRLTIEIIKSKEQTDET